MPESNSITIEEKTSINHKIVTCEPSEFKDMVALYDYALSSVDRLWIKEWLKFEAKTINLRLPPCIRWFGLTNWFIRQCRFTHWSAFMLSYSHTRDYLEGMNR